MWDVAVPVVPVKRFQLGHHGIPIPSNESARPHSPDEADRVEPLEPIRIETPQLPLTAAVENPDGQRRIFLVARRYVAVTVRGLESQKVCKSLLPPIRPYQCAALPNTRALESSRSNRFWFEQGVHNVKHPI